MNSVKKEVVPERSPSPVAPSNVAPQSSSLTTCALSDNAAQSRPPHRHPWGATALKLLSEELPGVGGTTASITAESLRHRLRGLERAFAPDDDDEERWLW